SRQALGDGSPNFQPLVALDIFTRPRSRRFEDTTASQAELCGNCPYRSAATTTPPAPRSTTRSPTSPKGSSDAETAIGSSNPCHEGEVGAAISPAPDWVRCPLRIAPESQCRFAAVRTIILDN